MTNGDLLKLLFSSFKQGDEGQFIEVARQIIVEEKKKNHNILARDLQRIIDNNVQKTSRTLSSWHKLPSDRESGVSLVEVREPIKQFSDIILNVDLSKQVEIIISEYIYRERLYTYGLGPKRKLLFAGLPGTGKTLLAEILASEIGLPILYVRFDSVVSSYLGETAANLRKIFEFASKGNWIVFFDEFDAIGKSREDEFEHGELKRVVNTFLQLLDNFESESIFVAATNHAQLLDSALWRRFDDILFFELPNDVQIHQLLMLNLRNFPHTVNLEDFIPTLSGWSHSDIELVCTDAIKRSIITDSSVVNDTILQNTIEHHKRRMNKIKHTTAVE